MHWNSIQNPSARSATSSSTRAFIAIPSQFDQRVDDSKLRRIEFKGFPRPVVVAKNSCGNWATASARVTRAEIGRELGAGRKAVSHSLLSAPCCARHDSNVSTSDSQLTLPEL